MKYVLLVIINLGVYLILYKLFGTFFWGVIAGIIQMTVNRLIIEEWD